MYAIPHVYLEIDGNKYYDYSLFNYTYEPSSYITPETFSIQKMLRDKLRFNLKDYIDESLCPPRGSKIHVVPKSKYAMNDIRRNYTIKRSSDAADYVVVPPLRDNDSVYSSVYYRLGIFPSCKTIVTGPYSYNMSKEEFITYVKTNAPELDTTEMVYVENQVTLYTFPISIYKAILDGNYDRNKMVLESNIDVSADTELTVDVLRLVYHTGLVSVYEKDARDNFLLQMNVMNNYNWRSYIGAVSLVMDLLYRKRGIAEWLKNRKSTLPKQILDIYEQVNNNLEFSNEKDFRLAQEFIADLMNIKGTVYTPFSILCQKMNEISLYTIEFESLFSDVVRIKPKEYNAQSISN